MKVFSRSPWRFDAVGASVAHSRLGSGSGALIMHCDNFFPGWLGFVEFRGSSKQFKRVHLPPAKGKSTFQVSLSDKDLSSVGREWVHVLCAHPPAGVGRFLTGERFQDGSLSIDHTYFQQPKESRSNKTREVNFFDRGILRDGVIGPSHPWVCVHSRSVETLVAIINLFHPDESHVYDLRVFDGEGELVLEVAEFVRLDPYGHEVFNISEALRRRGIDELDGTYLVTHSPANTQERLPNRLHAQGIWRFGGTYWNAVQADSSIFSSPDPPVPEIEQLSPAKTVRRKQYFFGPIIDSDHLETLVAVSNLSYSLHYKKHQTVVLRYCEGENQLAEVEIDLKPFGSKLINLFQTFGDHMTRRGNDGACTGTFVIYPKTGITYCASVMIREKQTGVFMVEHPLPMARLPAENATA